MLQELELKALDIGNGTSHSITPSNSIPAPLLETADDTTTAGERAQFELLPDDGARQHALIDQPSCSAAVLSSDGSAPEKDSILSYFYSSVEATANYETLEWRFRMPKGAKMENLRKESGLAERHIKRHLLNARFRLRHAREGRSPISNKLTKEMRQYLSPALCERFTSCYVKRTGNRWKRCSRPARMEHRELEDADNSSYAKDFDLVSTDINIGCESTSESTAEGDVRDEEGRQSQAVEERVPQSNENCGGSDCVLAYFYSRIEVFADGESWSWSFSFPVREDMKKLCRDSGLPEAEVRRILINAKSRLRKAIRRGKKLSKELSDEMHRFLTPTLRESFLSKCGKKKREVSKRAIYSAPDMHIVLGYFYSKVDKNPKMIDWTSWKRRSVVDDENFKAVCRELSKSEAEVLALLKNCSSRARTFLRYGVANSVILEEVERFLSPSSREKFLKTYSGNNDDNNDVAVSAANTSGTSSSVVQEKNHHPRIVDWFYLHLGRPVPTEANLKMLARCTKCTSEQVLTTLESLRRRLRLFLESGSPDLAEELRHYGISVANARSRLNPSLDAEDNRSENSMELE